MGYLQYLEFIENMALISSDLMYHIPIYYLEVRELLKARVAIKAEQSLPLALEHYSIGHWYLWLQHCYKSLSWWMPISVHKNEGL